MYVHCRIWTIKFLCVLLLFCCPAVTMIMKFNFDISPSGKDWSIVLEPMDVRSKLEFRWCHQQRMKRKDSHHHNQAHLLIHTERETDGYRDKREVISKANKTYHSLVQNIFPSNSCHERGQSSKWLFLLRVCMRWKDKESTAKRWKERELRRWPRFRRLVRGSFDISCCFVTLL